MNAATSVVRPPARKKASRSIPTSIQALKRDNLTLIFSFLDFVFLVRCSSVCKLWSSIIEESKLLERLYCKEKQSDCTDESESSWKILLEKLVMQRHKYSMQEGPVSIYQWRNFDEKSKVIGVDKCRMKRGLFLTGGASKSMQLWSAESYQCLGEYSVPDKSPLVDFDFDESKIVGLLENRICIWRNNGERYMFSSREGEITRGTCMRYIDPEAVVGCADGRARIFDMYSRKCSQIIKMDDAPVTCLCLTEGQQIIGGSSVGNITVTCPSSNQRVATLRSIIPEGISTMCFNPRSYSVFAGSMGGRGSCWDLRATRRSLWETRVSPNIIYSVHHLKDDTSALAIGGIDGILRIVDQRTGEIISAWFVEASSGTGIGVNSNSKAAFKAVESKQGVKIAEETNLDELPRGSKPAISCLAVGMQKIVTTHNDKFIRVWRFGNRVCSPELFGPCLGVEENKPWVIYLTDGG